VGVLLFPYLLRMVMTWLHLSLREKVRTARVVLLAHFYLDVVFSFAFNPMLAGVCYISVCLGGIVGALRG